MSRIRQIGVNGRKIGLIGLDEALEAVRAESGHRSEDEIVRELLRRLELNNYIPGPAREDYAKALRQEYRTVCGEVASPDRNAFPEIKILGQGCARCEKLTSDVLTVLAETGQKADVEHVRDLKAIAACGAWTVPALLIDGRMVCMGRNPSKNEIRGWLQEAGQYR